MKFNKFKTNINDSNLYNISSTDCCKQIEELDKRLKEYLESKNDIETYSYAKPFGSIISYPESDITSINIMITNDINYKGYTNQVNIPLDKVDKNVFKFAEEYFAYTKKNSYNLVEQVKEFLDLYYKI